MPEPLSTTFQGRDRLLDLLLEASEAVAEHVLDLDRLLRRTSELVRQVLDYEILAVLLVDSGGSDLRIRHAVGLPDEVVRDTRIPLGQGITGTAVSRQATVVSNNVLDDPRYICALESVRSEMAVPLVARGKVVGVLDLQSTAPDTFTDYERQMIQLIASPISLAIDNAHLFAETSNQAATLRTLLRLSEEFSTVLNTDHLMELIANVTRKLIDYDAYSIFLFDTERNELRHHASFRYDGRTRLETVPLDQGIIGAAARSRRPVLVTDTASDPKYQATSEGVKSEVALPMLRQGRLVGVLGLESDCRSHFTEDHVDTLSMLASQLASAVENARLYEQVTRDAARLKADLETARRIQQQLLLPPCPALQMLETSARNRPVMEVSGDFYDFYPFAGDRLTVVLGDVSGKGAYAALYGALTSGLMQSLVRSSPSPAKLLREVNRALAERQSDPSTYAAAMCVQWDPEDHSIVIANSGLPFPLHRQGDTVRPVPAAGIPLGMFLETEYEEHRVRLDSDDVLVMASDGVLDSDNTAQEPFGEDRLATAIAGASGCSADEIVERILGAVNRHTGEARVEDDQTLVVLRMQ